MKAASDFRSSFYYVINKLAFGLNGEVFQLSYGRMKVEKKLPFIFTPQIITTRKYFCRINYVMRIFPVDLKKLA
ncbi:MAG: hypothetical protein FD122_816 [Stygiobacter sp.]|nr:MAG: hypothetical protein FD122_816 [Stygiobacter sp.]KAF0214693.1 MAG: hypothetical protein FD178_2246 [Ignavibacteria bacterium]